MGDREDGGGWKGWIERKEGGLRWGGGRRGEGAEKKCEEGEEEVEGDKGGKIRMGGRRKE